MKGIPIPIRSDDNLSFHTILLFTSLYATYSPVIAIAIPFVDVVEHAVDHVEAAANPV